MIRPRFPKYENTDESIITDTRLFLAEVIGSYIEININSNKLNYHFFVSKEMVKNHALSDNARCYTTYSVPTLEREYGIIEVLKKLCDTRIVPNTTFFIAVGDFPVLMRNKKKHPHCDRYTGDYEDIYPKKLAKIFSRSIIRYLHNDLMFPTRDFIDVVHNKTKYVSSTNHNFYGKKSMAIFRGSLTGNNRTITNTRICARMLSLKYPTYLDVHITRTFEYYMYEDVGCIHTVIDDKRIYDEENCNKQNMTLEEQANKYKYILHIDGFVSAWRLALEMLSMSTILKVYSDWEEHYYCGLIPWVHYVPVKADLSNLIQIIEWCRDNDDACFNIAKNAFIFATENFTNEKILDYVESKVWNKKLIVGWGHPKLYTRIKPPCILPSKPREEARYDFTKIGYKRYYLKQNNGRHNIMYPKKSFSIVPKLNKQFVIYDHMFGDKTLFLIQLLEEDKLVFMMDGKIESSSVDVVASLIIMDIESHLNVKAGEILLMTPDPKRFYNAISRAKYENKIIIIVFLSNDGKIIIDGRYEVNAQRGKILVLNNTTDIEHIGKNMNHFIVAAEIKNVGFTKYIENINDMYYEDISFDDAKKKLLELEGSEYNAISFTKREKIIHNNFYNAPEFRGYDMVSNITILNNDNIGMQYKICGEYFGSNSLIPIFLKTDYDIIKSYVYYNELSKLENEFEFEYKCYILNDKIKASIKDAIV